MSELPIDDVNNMMIGFGSHEKSLDLSETFFYEKLNQK